MKIENPLSNLQFAENIFSNGIELKEGQVFRARISQVMGDLITLDLGKGKQIEAKTIIPFDSNDISSVFYFTVKEAKQDAILIRPSVQSEIDFTLHKEKETKIIETLKSLDLKPDEEKIQLIKELIKNNIPITKEIIQNLYQSKLLFNKIEDTISNRPFLISEADLDKGVSELAKDFLGRLDEIHIKNTGAEGLQAFKSNESPTIQMINMRNVDFQKLIFLFKNNIKINLENLTHLNNIVLKERSITKQIYHLVNLLSQNDETSYLAKEIVFTLKNFKTTLIEKQFRSDQIMKDLESKLEFTKRSMENIFKISTREIIKNIEGLQKGLEFIRQINHPEVYLQIPIWLDQQPQDLDVFIYKNKQSKSNLNPKDCSILLALDTEHLKKIRILVKIKEKSIDCSFYIETDQIQSVIKKYQNYLESSLSSLGFKQINIHFIISTTQENILNFESEWSQNLSRMNSIDLRV